MWYIRKYKGEKGEDAGEEAQECEGRDRLQF